MSATMPTTWTIKALLTWTTDYLKTKGIEAPRLESQILLAHVMGVARIELVARSEEQPTESERARFKDLIRQRVEGCPVAYLVGHRDFYLLSFEVTPAVLVPRPDTETLVEQALRFLQTRPTARVLDLGTGSGCIAVSLAHQAKQIQVTAVDISPDAADVARRNAARHGVAERVKVITGDLFAPLPAEARFDLIVSNPPYISRNELAELSSDVRDHEPLLALDGGPDGLAYYRRLAAESGRFLAPGGTVMVEIGWTQEPAVRELFTMQPDLAVGRSIKDLGGRFRVVTANRPA